MIVKLLGNRVLIEPLRPPEALRSAIVLPPAVAKKPSPDYGLIRLLGSTVRAPLRVGDLVKLNPDRGSVETDFHGAKCRIHSVLDVQAVISQNDGS